ncbi:hypothetical protein HNR53_001764 [Bacillus benzoevorans]|uniref:Uncharacterized protein n=1 Tax=Bacillus benzoevorans TaxID=1456 RepID=A0A7X0LWA9_9BACI|nr:hypothetical protein [Bacillus benzoevorans]
MATGKFIYTELFYKYFELLDSICQLFSLKDLSEKPILKLSQLMGIANGYKIFRKEGKQ